MTPGKIVIKDKVYFEPDGLEKPNEDHYFEGRNWAKKSPNTYEEDLEECEASKQLIEVENWVTIDVVDKNCSILLLGKKQGQHEYMWDKDSCEAEVENNIATIIKIS